jgi:hypothetical protein
VPERARGTINVLAAQRELADNVTVRRVATAAVVVLAIAQACGDPSSTQIAAPSSEATATMTISSSTMSPPTTTAVGASSTPASPPSSTQVATESIVTNLGVVSFALPADVGPDPMPMSALPDFVVGYDKWFVECCYLKIAVQNLDPPFPERERIDGFESHNMDWTIYDTGPRDGTTVVATATQDAVTVLVSAQARFPEEAAEGAAQRVAEQVARSVVVSDSTSP